MDDDWDFFDDPKPASNFEKNATKPTSTSKEKHKRPSLSSNSSGSDDGNFHGTDHTKTDSITSADSDTEDPTPKNNPSISSTSRSSSSKSIDSYNKTLNDTYTKLDGSSTSESGASGDKYSRDFSSRKSPKNSKYRLVSSSSDESGQSSDSVTDVSPLSTPEASPKFKRKNRRIPESKAEKDNYQKMKHVTKLNVTFGSKQTKELSEKEYRNSNKYLDYGQDPHEIYRQQLQCNYDLSCSDDDYEDDMKYWGHPKAGCNRRRTDAIEKHRKRMLSSSANRTMDISKLLETVLDFDKQQKQRRQKRNGADFVLSPGRKNMSFTNVQVNEIDRENDRLLKEITKSRRNRPSSASSIRSTSSNASTISRSSKQSRDSFAGSGTRRRQINSPVKLYHSAQNRLQYQRQIERENLQLLKRLRSAKGTPELRKSRQLDDYKRQTKYMGVPIEHSGMTARQANELTRNSEVVREAIGFQNSRRKPVRPTWQDAW